MDLESDKINTGIYTNELAAADKLKDDTLTGSKDEPIITEKIKSEPKDTSQPKTKKKKCGHCRKKLGIIYFICKCGKILCQTHLNAHSHNCSYDYALEKKNKLETENPKLNQKMIKI